MWRNGGGRGRAGAKRRIEESASRAQSMEIITRVFEWAPGGGGAAGRKRDRWSCVQKKTPQHLKVYSSHVSCSTNTKRFHGISVVQGDFLRLILHWAGVYLLYHSFLSLSHSLPLSLPHTFFVCGSLKEPSDIPKILIAMWEIGMRTDDHERLSRKRFCCKSHISRDAFKKMQEKIFELLEFFFKFTICILQPWKLFFGGPI